MSEQTQAASKSTKKKAVKTKGQKKAKGAPKKARKEKEENLVVFAHRMTLQEREAFHTAAGPARASKVARQLAVAFTNEDDAAFRALIKEAREVRG